MKEKPECEWFVEPLDNDTNTIVFQRLGRKGVGGVEDEIINLPDTEGKLHDVVRVPGHPFVAQLQRSRQNLDLHLRVFTREGTRKLKPWPFNAKKRLPPEVQERINKARKTDVSA